jgi:hypothetical protein
MPLEVKSPDMFFTATSTLPEGHIESPDLPAQTSLAIKRLQERLQKLHEGDVNIFAAINTDHTLLKGCRNAGLDVFVREGEPKDGHRIVTIRFYYVEGRGTRNAGINWRAGATPNTVHTARSSYLICDTAGVHFLQGLPKSLTEVQLDTATGVYGHDWKRVVARAMIKDVLTAFREGHMLGSTHIGWGVSSKGDGTCIYLVLFADGTFSVNTNRTTEAALKFREAIAKVTGMTLDAFAALMRTRLDVKPGENAVVTFELFCEKMTAAEEPGLLFIHHTKTPVDPATVTTTMAYGVDWLWEKMEGAGPWVREPNGVQFAITVAVLAEMDEQTQINALLSLWRDAKEHSKSYGDAGSGLKDGTLCVVEGTIICAQVWHEDGRTTIYQAVKDKTALYILLHRFFMFRDHVDPTHLLVQYVLRQSVILAGETPMAKALTTMLRDCDSTINASRAYLDAIVDTLHSETPSPETQVVIAARTAVSRAGHQVHAAVTHITAMKDGLEKAAADAKLQSEKRYAATEVSLKEAEASLNEAKTKLTEAEAAREAAVRVEAKREDAGTTREAAARAKVKAAHAAYIASKSGMSIDDQPHLALIEDVLALIKIITRPVLGREECIMLLSTILWKIAIELPIAEFNEVKSLLPKAASKKGHSINPEVFQRITSISPRLIDAAKNAAPDVYLSLNDQLDAIKTLAGADNTVIFDAFRNAAVNRQLEDTLFQLQKRNSESRRQELLRTISHLAMARAEVIQLPLVLPDLVETEVQRRIASVQKQLPMLDFIFTAPPKVLKKALDDLAKAKKAKKVKQATPLRVRNALLRYAMSFWTMENSPEAETAEAKEPPEAETAEAKEPPEAETAEAAALLHALKSDKSKGALPLDLFNVLIAKLSDLPEGSPLPAWSPEDIRKPTIEALRAEVLSCDHMGTLLFPSRIKSSMARVLCALTGMATLQWHHVFGFPTALIVETIDHGRRDAAQAANTPSTETMDPDLIKWANGVISRLTSGEEKAEGNATLLVYDLDGTIIKLTGAQENVSRIWHSKDRGRIFCEPTDAVPMLTTLSSHLNAMTVIASGAPIPAPMALAIANKHGIPAVDAVTGLSKKGTLKPLQQKALLLQYFVSNGINVIGADDQHIPNAGVPMLHITKTAYMGRAVVMSGPPGSGKSSLSNQLSQRTTHDVRTVSMSFDDANQSEEADPDPDRSDPMSSFSQMLYKPDGLRNCIMDRVALDLRAGISGIHAQNATLIMVVNDLFLKGTPWKTYDVNALVRAAVNDKAKAKSKTAVFTLENGILEVLAKYADFLDEHRDSVVRYLTDRIGNRDAFFNDGVRDPNAPQQCVSTFDQSDAKDLPALIDAARDGARGMVERIRNIVSKSKNWQRDIQGLPRTLAMVSGNLKGTQVDELAELLAAETVQVSEDGGLTPKAPFTYAGVHLPDGKHSTLSIDLTDEYRRNLVSHAICNGSLVDIKLLTQYIVVVGEGTFIFDHVELPESVLSLKTTKSPSHVTRSAPPGKAYLCGSLLQQILTGKCAPAKSEDLKGATVTGRLATF